MVSKSGLPVGLFKPVKGSGDLYGKRSCAMIHDKGLDQRLTAIAPLVEEHDI